MPASRPYKYQKSTKNKTQNRRDLIYRTSLNQFSDKLFAGFVDFCEYCIYIACIMFALFVVSLVIRG